MRSAVCFSGVTICAYATTPIESATTRCAHDELVTSTILSGNDCALRIPNVSVCFVTFTVGCSHTLTPALRWAPVQMMNLGHAGFSGSHMLTRVIFMARHDAQCVMTTFAEYVQYVAQYCSGRTQVTRPKDPNNCYDRICCITAGTLSRSRKPALIVPSAQPLVLLIPSSQFLIGAGLVAQKVICCK